MNSEPELEPGVKILPVVGYEGLYSVTDDGRVWSEERRVLFDDGRQRVAGGRWLGQWLGTNRYYFVALSRNGECYRWHVHTLVAVAFLGAKPERYDVDHIDRDRLNNRAANLRYVTRCKNLHNVVAVGCVKIGRTGRWRARIKHMYKTQHLGYFSTEAEAHAAYLAAKEKLMAEIS
mgnify:CR=1 FL=1